MYDIYYENNYHEKAILTEWPYMVTDGDIFNSSWNEIENDDHIQGFEKNISTRKLQLNIEDPVDSDFQSAVDFLESVTEKDIVGDTPGRLYVGESYLRCWLQESNKSKWIYDQNYLTNELKVITDYPYWITEKKYSFYKSTGDTSTVASGWLEYPYEYSFEYAKDRNVQYLVNDHYADSGFKIIIYGPCINPLIRIAGHVYELNTTLYDGEYAAIDSSTRYAYDRSICKISQDGTQHNLFNDRNKHSDIWKKIPAGKNTVTWNGNFGFDVILFSERSAPKWTL